MEKTIVTRSLALLSVLALCGACDSGSGEAVDADAPAPAPDGEGEFVVALEDGCPTQVMTTEQANHIGPGAGIAGRIVSHMCEPLPEFKVLSCTAESCVPTDTLADGSFYLGGIMNKLPRKVRVVGVTNGYFDALFYLGIEPNELSMLSIPVVLVPLTPYAELDDVGGGSVMLAGDQLELSVEAGALQYPLGHFVQEGADFPELAAQRLDPALVGPFYDTPWEGKSGAMAFVFDPYDITVDAESPASLAFHVADHAAPGTVYDIWTVETSDAHMLEAGTATVGEDGVIRSDEGAEILNLQTVVIAPQ
jgi:hypothetical protein